MDIKVIDKMIDIVGKDYVINDISQNLHIYMMKLNL